MNTKAQMAGRVMAVIFGTILLVSVSIPITNSIIATEQVIRVNGTITQNGSLDGITLVIVGFIPLFLGLAGLALAASLVTA